MDKKQAITLVEQTFPQPFEKEQFHQFVAELLHRLDDSPERQSRWPGQSIKKAYQDYINNYERLGTYTDPEGRKLDVLVIHLKKDTTLERGRTRLRNFAADYLSTGHGNDKDAVLAAYVSPEEDDWRFSFVKLEYALEQDETGNVKERKELTPARRYSFLVGANERSHTAQKQFLPLLVNDQSDPSLAEIEETFKIEKVTKEFFDQYKELFEKTKAALEDLIKRDARVCAEFKDKSIEADDFAKKLLGQIVFLYFLQKKGWFGVERDAAWGTGDKHYLRHLFDNRERLGKQQGKTKKQSVNFFNDILEHMFYDALARERDNHYYGRFDCYIPFLNGGLFEPLQGYSWDSVDILLPDELFSNDELAKDDDIGTGILDVFDRYNFTVNEAEPLETEVAVDPEMLGKVFENLLPENLRYKSGTYYTPRVIVSYMCQQSLINYLASCLEGKVGREDIEALITRGERHADFEANPNKEHKNKLLPGPIRQHAKDVDQLLAKITVCDPAIGSGAFPVGMMQEIVKARLTLADVEGMPARKPYDLKRHAIENSLYGVDFDPGAIEIARLRLWLSLVVDEDEFQQIQPLPNLDYKIMQGNSLLEEFAGIKLLDDEIVSEPLFDIEAQITDISAQINELNREASRIGVREGRRSPKILKIEEEIAQLKKQRSALSKETEQAPQQGSFQDLHSQARQKLGELKRLHKEFFEQSSPAKKRSLRERVEQLEWEFMEASLKEHGDGKALTELAKHRRDNRKNYFLWKLHFVEVFQDKRGFDIVIANPPYISALEFSSNFPEPLRKALNRRYLAAKGTYDLYVLFIELGIRLLNQKGSMSFINPNKFLSAKYGAGIRQFILDNAELLRIVDVSGIRVFESAAVYPILLFLQSIQKQKRVNSTSQVEMILPVNRHLDEFRLSKFGSYTIDRNRLTSLPENLWGFLLSNQFKILSQLMRECVPLRELGEINATSTAAEADLYGRFISEVKEKDSIKIINTGTIDPYQSLWGQEFLTHSGNKFLTPYLSLSKADVNQRRKEMYRTPKIIFSKMAKRCEAFADLTGEYASINTNCFYKPVDGISLHYITAVCNSKLFMFFYDQFFGALRMSGGYYQFQAPQLRVLPFKKISLGEQAPFIILVEYINYLKAGVGRNNDRDQLMVSYFEQLIDALVYEVYLPSEISVAGKQFFAPLMAERLPALNEIKGDKLAALRQIFERLYDRNHIIRKNIFFLDTIESVRIIEGKA